MLTDLLADAVATPLRCGPGIPTLILLALAPLPYLAGAEFSTPDEMHAAQQWLDGHLTGAGADLPFSFVYGGQPAKSLLPSWTTAARVDRLDALRTQHSRTWTDPATGLEVRCVEVDYADYPAGEWTVSFTNTGTAATPILEQIQGLDAGFARGPTGEFVLHGIAGDIGGEESYKPYEVALGPGLVRHVVPDAGRPTFGVGGWPYFDLQWPGGGVMLAIGWPGRWAATFSRDANDGLRIAAGQETTRLSLRPGETIRAPLIALVFWRGDDVQRAQNLWRRWFMAHNIPRVAGKPPEPMMQMQLSPTCHGSAEEQMREATRFADAGVDIDLYWNDAGWYPCPGGSWNMTGTWEVDAKRYPQDFKPIADWIHARGKKFITWFEPERVGDPSSWLAVNHPEWLLSGTLVDLGRSEPRTWVIERVDSLLIANDIDYYRQDFNIDPLTIWRQADAPDRQGATENLYVQGYLAFWDEIRRRHPGLLIDSCSGGGARNDLETLRRAVPLLRSDYQSSAHLESQQGQTYGLAQWLPYSGTGTDAIEKYAVRSFYLPCFGDFNPVKERYDECRLVAPLMLGDYYPLTPYSLALNQWIAWQFARPEQGDGVVQVFRRGQCADATQVYRLRGLDPAARYAITDLDAADHPTRTGKELMDPGLTVTMTTAPQATIIVYRRLK